VEGLQRAITLAKLRGADEVEPDDVLLGCLWAISRFGVARVGPYLIDLDELRVDWIKSKIQTGVKVAYSEATVVLLDRAAAIARADGAETVGIAHLLAAFPLSKPKGVIAKLCERHGIGSATWRAAVATLDTESAPASQSGSAEYLSPEQAAELLGVHQQTIRGYIRSGKLPALRIAGERAVRIRRENLDRLLEPLTI